MKLAVAAVFVFVVTVLIIAVAQLSYANDSPIDVHVEPTTETSNLFPPPLIIQAPPAQPVLEPPRFTG